jgi:hypothetical protein
MICDSWVKEPKTLVPGEGVMAPDRELEVMIGEAGGQGFRSCPQTLGRGRGSPLRIASGDQIREP